MPANSCAIRASLAPPPGRKTLPTAMSLFKHWLARSAISRIKATYPMLAGLTLLLFITSSKTAASNSSGFVSLKPPFFLPFPLDIRTLFSKNQNTDRLTLVRAVRKALTMTTSSAELTRRRARPKEGREFVKLGRDSMSTLSCQCDGTSCEWE